MHNYNNGNASEMPCNVVYSIIIMAGGYYSYAIQYNIPGTCIREILGVTEENSWLYYNNLI